MNTFSSSEPILLFSSTAISLVAGPIRFKVVPLFRLLTASTNSYIPFVGTRFPINAILLYVRGDKSTSVITFIKLGAICTFPLILVLNLGNLRISNQAPKLYHIMGESFSAVGIAIPSLIIIFYTAIMTMQYTLCLVFLGKFNQEVISKGSKAARRCCMHNWVMV